MRDIQFSFRIKFVYVSSTILRVHGDVNHLLYTDGMFIKSDFRTIFGNRLVANSIKRDARLSPVFISIANLGPANQLLIDADRILEHESGFFRIGPNPLPKRLVSSLSSEVRALTLKHVMEYRETVPHRVQNLIASNSYPSNNFGYLFAFDFFQEMICSNAPSEIQKAMRAYIQSSILTEDVLGRFDGQGTARRTFNIAIAEYIEKRKKNDQLQDLLDVAIKASDTPKEQAEIFHRLVLATIGFTGCALEWSLIGLARQKKFINGEAFALEALRFYSPIWRLTRRVGIETELNGMLLRPGDRVFINLFQINKSLKMGKFPRRFNPHRMMEDDAKRNSLSFGKGKRSCPAQRPALLFLSITLSEIHKQYQLGFKRNIFSLPRFSTFISCPNGYFKLTPK